MNLRLKAALITVAVVFAVLGVVLLIYAFPVVFAAGVLTAIVLCGLWVIYDTVLDVLKDHEEGAGR